MVRISGATARVHRYGVWRGFGNIMRNGGKLTQKGEHIIAALRVFQARKIQLCPADQCARVFKTGIQTVKIPDQPVVCGTRHPFAVEEPLRLPRRTVKNTVRMGADAVGGPLSDLVATDTAAVFLGLP